MTVAEQATPLPGAGMRTWAGLGVLTLATVVIAVDMTVLHLAVPHLSADLGLSSTQLLWVVDIYSFVIAGLLITMGAAGDRFGRRRLLLAGAGLFGAASVAAAFAPSAGMLIAARAVLGIAGAMLMPATLSLVRTMFTQPRQRGIAIAIWSAGFASGATLGPVIGGALLQYFWWGAVFLLAVPVMALVVTLGPVLVPRQSGDRSRRLDPISAGLWLTTMLALVYGLKTLTANSSGMSAVWPVAAVAGGLALGVVFVRRQRRLAEPLLDLELISRREFATPLGAVLVATMSFAAVQYFLGQQLQALSGLSPLQAGLTLLPGAAASTVGTLAAPLLARRIPTVGIIAVAMVLMATGFATLIGLTPASSAGAIGAAFALMAIGFGPVVALGTTMMTSAAPPDRAGAAAGIVSTNGDLSVSLGIAVLGSVGAAIYRGQLTEHLSQPVPEAATETIGGAVAAAEQLPADASRELLNTAAQAFTSGLQLIGGLAAVATLAMAAILVVLLRATPSSQAVHPVEDRADQTTPGLTGDDPDRTKHLDTGRTEGSPTISSARESSQPCSSN